VRLRKCAMKRKEIVADLRTDIVVSDGALFWAISHSELDYVDASCASRCHRNQRSENGVSHLCVSKKRRVSCHPNLRISGV